MKTHNVIIYHCLTCGSVVHAEPEAETPQCCGHSMVNAAAQTVIDSDDVEPVPASHCDIEGPVSGRKKPR